VAVPGFPDTGNPARGDSTSRTDWAVIGLLLVLLAVSVYGLVRLNRVRVRNK
jgi:hypothetical protein